MNNYIFTNPINGTNWKRITKNQARKVFNAGYDFIILPCKCRLFTPWHLECYIDGYSKNEPDRTFDTIVNAFIYYNCNSEMGYYPSFYILDNE